MWSSKHKPKPACTGYGIYPIFSIGYIALVILYNYAVSCYLNREMPWSILPTLSLPIKIFYFTTSEWWTNPKVFDFYYLYIFLNKLFNGITTGKQDAIL